MVLFVHKHHAVALRVVSRPYELDAGGFVGAPPSISGTPANDNAVTAPTIFHIDARGAQQCVAEEIRIALERYDRKTLPRRVNELKGNSLVVNG